MHVILGTSKLSAFPGAIVAAARFAKSGLVQWKLALPCGLIAALGAFAGARIALGVDEAVIRSLMVVVLPVVAFYVLRSKPDPGEEEKAELPFEKLLIPSLAASFVIGAYDGFYGPGTGTFFDSGFRGTFENAYEAFRRYFQGGKPGRRYRSPFNLYRQRKGECGLRRRGGAVLYGGQLFLAPAWW